MVKIKKCKVKLVVDSREQKCQHITDIWEKGLKIYPSQHEKKQGKEAYYTEPIQYYEIPKGLKTGDFTIAVQLPNEEVINFADKIVIERKASLSELVGNLNDSKSINEAGLNRFERELLRAKENGIKVILLVEVGEGYSKANQGVFRHDVLSKMRPLSYQAKIFSLKARYGFELVYLDKRDTGKYIYEELFYFAREYLKNMEG
jgi:ERCC4-type nuclease